MPICFEDFLYLVTHLGDSGLLMMLSSLCALYLYASGNKRTAVVLASVLFLCMGIMTVLKIYFIGCYHRWPSLGIESPSGHAAMGAAIYGTLAAIISRHFSGWRRVLAPVLVFPLVLTIAASRVLLGMHQISEVLLGLAVGIALALLAFIVLKDSSTHVFRLRYLVLTSLLAVVLLYGTQTPAETFLRRLALFVNDTLPFCT
jgi:membrane-associated phospholipid phosphatase